MPSRRRFVHHASALLAGTLLVPRARAESSGTADASAALRYAGSPRVDSLAAQLAQQTGLDAAWLAAQIGQAQFQPAVTQLIIPGKPGQKNWQVYRSRFVEPVRIDAGADFLQEFDVWLRKAEARFGVPRHIIVGILGVETIYGRHMGNFRVLDALATLSMDFPAAAPKDRSAYFASQLGDYFLWCRQSDFDPTAVKGSYAGAIGMPQFMPGNILRYAVNFEGGTKVDIINSPADAIGSVGNYLAGHDWQPGQPTHFPLLVPSDVPPETLAKLLEPDIVPSFTPQELRAAGLPLLPRVLDYPGKLAVVQLPNAGSKPDYILGTDNFYVVTRYNHSAFYALAVIELGQAAMAAAQG
ncbi:MULTISPECIES: lytic murein transglycosylase B [Thiomonas]|jgi:membrane-bound lytic murein transglycosylase B|uniref:Putative Lytic murein transglycosylase B n=1 Tax=Thiomonas delicata TaxID=364030 RepID=A0A238D9B7_THIDL|nr:MULTISPECIES: lytic murein transglycosylase B [Thiomonas]SBP89913.1 putative Lytic murein transglycosylase B [Thiomonas delicata]